MEFTYEEILSRPRFVDRFLSKFDIPDDYVNECWVWKDKPHRGYGIINGGFQAGNYVYRAIRLSVCYYKHPLTEGLCIDHLCRNTICVNPWHLEEVTFYENTRRGLGFSTQNRLKTHCPQGHEYLEDNTLWLTNPNTGQIGRFCAACREERNFYRRKWPKSDICCRYGHFYNEDNPYDKFYKDGTIYRKCNVCQHIRNKAKTKRALSGSPSTSTSSSVSIDPALETLP